jgi:gliding motility-associated-like protein
MSIFRFKKTFILVKSSIVFAFIFSPCFLLVNAQTTMVNGGSSAVCSGTFQDPNGAANYAGGNSTISHTFCNPTPNQPLYMNFTQFDLWRNGCIFGASIDKLEIHDGPTAASPQIAGSPFSDQGSPGQIIGTSGCLTFVFIREDFGGFLCNSNSGDPGWNATVSCTPPPPSGDICTQALPFCTSNTYAFQNNTNVPQQGGPNYGCLATQPNPVWYYMQVDQASTFQIQMSQTTGPNGTGSGIDVDFALYGPFTSVSTGCGAIMGGGLSPIQCSYSTAATETVGIGLPGGTGSGASTPPATAVDQYYIIVLTNYANQNGYISFNQSGGTGVADCSIINPPTCQISTTPTVTACTGGTFGLVSSSANGTSFSWTGPGAFASGSLSPSGITSPAVPGTYNYIVTATTAGGQTCKDTAVVTVPVIPNIDFNFDSTVCISQTQIFLEASPVGGIFSGTGVVAGPGGQYFNTSGGNQTVTYTLSNGCNFSENIPVQILPNPIVDGGDTIFICAGSPVTLLTGSTPAGGNYSGTGVSMNIFDPTFGSNTISYIYIDANGCAAQDSLEVAIAALPSFVLPTQTACITAPDVTLTATPVGTIFSGTGVTGSTFDPSVGTQTITYAFTDANGCFNDTTKVFTVNTLPIVSAGSYGPVCVNATAVDLNGGTPAGGTYSGTGVTGTSFTPSSNTQTITYSYTDGNSCTNTATTVITVNALPIVSAGTYGPVCVNALPVNLNNGTPIGGTYSGTGVTGTSFSPSSNTQTITYSYTDANTCTNTATTVITVNPLPVVSAGTYGPVCINAAAVALNGGTPAGGTYSGTGVTGTNFSPSSNTQTITYSFTDANTCTNTATTVITVNPLPVVTAGTYGPVCVNAAAVNLNGGTPAGGTYSGTGVTGTSFSPSSNTQTITYSFTNANGCANTATTVVTVNALPTVSAGTYAAVCNAAPNVTLTGSPLGGVFTGTGVTGSTFDPSSNTQTVTYSYTSPITSCSNTATTVITVNAQPVVDAGSIQAVCFGVPVTVVGSGANTYTWSNGVTNNSPFSPTSTNLYTVTGTDANGCTDTDTVTVVVYSLPITNAVADTTFGAPGLNVLFGNLSSNALGYTWDFGNGQTETDVLNDVHEVVYENPGIYSVVLTSTNLHCSSIDTLTIIVSPFPDAIIVVPNIITPNADGDNDLFFMPVTYGATINVLVLNRWGQVMTEQKDFTARWDGKWNGNDAVDGTYFYRYVITDKNGKEYKGQSTLTVVR